MIVRETELKHHGVLGMKWGHRKAKHVKRRNRKIAKLTSYRDQAIKVAKNNYIKSKTSSKSSKAVGVEMVKRLENLDMSKVSKKDIRRAQNDAINFIINMDDTELKKYIKSNNI